MLRTIKPKNARVKRALEAREPKEVEDARTAIFIKGTHTGEKASAAMKELMALKRPDAISFSKKNTVRPFEDTSSLEFWANKNDASLFVIGQSTKKRPDGLTFVRMYDQKVLDIVEVGVDNFVSMANLKTPKSTPGHKPLLHFASDLFDTHPCYIQFKSLFIDFFNGQVVDSICLSGIEHVISVSTSPTPTDLNTAFDTIYPPVASTSTTLLSPTQTSQKLDTTLPKIHIRTYTLSLNTRITSNTTRHPNITLTPMGPFLDITLRRHTPPDPELWRLATKRPKLKKQDVEKGLGKKRKNLEVDEMGDLRGRIHLKKQDLEGLKGRKMKGLRNTTQNMGNDGRNVGDHETSGANDGEEERGERKQKRARTS